MPGGAGEPRLGAVQADRPTRHADVRSLVAVVLVLFTLSLAVVTGGEPTSVAVVVPVAVAAVSIGATAWLLMRSRRERREYEHRLTTWAGEQAAQAERLRIARDLHDLTSHGLGLITVRAAAGSSGGGAEQTAALADIERIGRETTTELRRMLTLLRTPNPGPAPLQPAETLADLPRIVETARATGLRVVLDADDTGHVSPGAQLTVCAVVREALSNTVRHAGPTSAVVRVSREVGALVTTVHDDGPVGGWEAHPGAGHGLAGLHERVTAVGGTLHAGPDGPGWAVAAGFPDEPTS